MGFILRVDDVGWNPDKTRDKDLAYFCRWRDTLGLQGCPVYYGVIPQYVREEEVAKFHQILQGDEELAVHGWDHIPGAVVEQYQMQSALERLRGKVRCRSYIPPFNVYKQKTIEDWGKACPNGYFFGNFPDLTTFQGILPTTYRTGYFLSAVRPLYDHSDVLLHNVPQWESLDCPLVVTVHATWGVHRMDLVRALGEMLKDKLVSIDSARAWCIKISDTLNRARLTAPHYLAYRWILSHLGGTGIHTNCVLDFGARYSVLPALMVLHGQYVHAVDRDPSLHSYQSGICERLGVRNVSTQIVSDPKEILGTYDTVVCCWAMQHNLPAETIPPIVESLASKIKSGGRLLIVGSFNHEASREQRDRTDPQVILNQYDYEKLIFKPSGMKLTSQEYFWYEHGSALGEFCSPEKATATCCELVKS